LFHHNYFKDGWGLDLLCHAASCVV
jgi:hypothetical protein